MDISAIRAAVDEAEGSLGRAARRQLAALDAAKTKVGKILDVERGPVLECPHCDYTGATEPRRGREPFRMLWKTTSAGPLVGPLTFCVTSAEQIPDEVSDEVFLCGDCLGEFVLSESDRERIEEV